MAPEAPPSLLVLDVHETDGGLEYAVERWDPADDAAKSLLVLWNASACPEGYRPVGGGVVCVASPPGFTARSYAAWPRARLDPLVLSWRDHARDDVLMLVVTLPVGYVFA